MSIGIATITIGLGIGSVNSGCIVTFTTGGHMARPRALVRRRGRSIERGHAKQLAPTIGTFTWVVLSLRIGRTTTTGATNTTRSGALSRLRRHGLPRRLRDRKRIRFPLRVRRTRHPTSGRLMRSIHAPQGGRRLRLTRNTPVRSGGHTRRIIRTNNTLTVLPTLQSRDPRMHHSRLCALLIDCKTSDVDEAARFWAQALGRPVDPNHPGSRGNYRMLETPPDEPIVQIQRVNHESRVHIDIETDDIPAEVARLEKLGAKVAQRLERWIVMEAPTGQRFCVVRVQRPGFPKNANRWE